MNRGSDRGLLVTLEGIEGVGKSTHVPFVADCLRRHRREVVLTREPGGTPIGEAIRGIVLDRNHTAMADITELLLMFAARAEHIERVIRPALDGGRDVVCDRFTDATYAYQGGGRGLAAERIAALETLVQQGLQPDLTLLFDCPVAVAMGRIGQRGEGDRFEQEQTAFFERVRGCYLARAERSPHRFRVIDASRTIAEVRADIERHLHILVEQA